MDLDKVILSLNFFMFVAVFRDVKFQNCQCKKGVPNGFSITVTKWNNQSEPWNNLWTTKRDLNRNKNGSIIINTSIIFSECKYFPIIHQTFFNIIERVILVVVMGR